MRLFPKIKNIAVDVIKFMLPRAIVLLQLCEFKIRTRVQQEDSIGGFGYSVLTRGTPTNSVVAGLQWGTCLWACFTLLSKFLSVRYHPYFIVIFNKFTNITTKNIVWRALIKQFATWRVEWGVMCAGAESICITIEVTLFA